MLNRSGKNAAVVLVNLGSPDAPDATSVRRFLREFLSDPRVVNLPRALWWFILNFFILPLRPRRSAKAYREIWTEAGSPLVSVTQQLAYNLAKAITDDSIQVICAMRYGQPSIAKQFKRLKDEGVEEIIVLPLYPQYSSTTTASVVDAMMAVFAAWRHIPNFKFVSDYHDHEAYIEAVSQSIESFWRHHGKNELLLISFHGIPVQLTEWGDPYYMQCQQTAAKMTQRLGLTEDQWCLVFQSRFGRAQWLQPYCLDILRALPDQGVRNIDIVCPGFAVDCLETLEEIAITNRHEFIAAGGESFRYIPALNASDAHVKTLLQILSEGML